MQSFPFTVRKAGTAEAAEAFQLIEEYYEEIAVLVREDRAQLKPFLTMENGGIWLGWAGAESLEPASAANAIGCILLRPLPSLENAAEIKRLYVRPMYRGAGVADALLLALEKYAAGRGIAWLYLDTKDDLTPAIRFYERSGYRQCERYNSNPQATIFMRKPL